MLVDGTRIAIGRRRGRPGLDRGRDCSGDGHRAPSCVIPIAALAACFPDAAQTAASIDADEAAGSAVGFARIAARARRSCCATSAAVAPPLHITTAREQLHGTIDRVAPGSPRSRRARARRRRAATARCARVRMLPMPRSCSSASSRAQPSARER